MIDIREKVARAIAERRRIGANSEASTNPYHLSMADAALEASGYHKMRAALEQCVMGMELLCEAAPYDPTTDIAAARAALGEDKT